MPHNIFVYLGDDLPSDPKEGQKHLERYQQWLNSLGDKVISPVVSLKDTHTVQPDGTASPGTTSAMPGHIINQDSRLLKEGPAANRTCPILEINGVLDDSEMPRQPSDKGRDKLNQVRTMR